MLTVNTYKSKKELKENVGKALRYEETSMFGAEYGDNASLTVARRPHLAGGGREFFAEVKMKDGVIASVK